MGVAAWLATSAAGGAGPHGFSFVTPQGFVSLKESEPLPVLAAGDAHYIDEAKTTDAYAVKLRDGAVIAVFMAKVVKGAAPLVNFSTFVSDSLEKQPGITNVKVVSSRIQKITGVECGRLEAESSLNGTARRELYYALPGRDYWALAKVSSAGDDYRQRFIVSRTRCSRPAA